MAEKLGFKRISFDMQKINDVDIKDPEPLDLSDR